MIESFLLKYYEILWHLSIIDLEMEHDGALGSGADLILKAQKAVEPTKEEARRILGMD